jgi:hypothetical protein
MESPVRSCGSGLLLSLEGQHRRADVVVEPIDEWLCCFPEFQCGGMDRGRCHGGQIGDFCRRNEAFSAQLLKGTCVVA